MALADTFLKGKQPQSTQFIVELHRTLLLVKLAHYETKSFAAHEALGKTYDTVNDLADDITEKLIGYTGEVPTVFEVGTIAVMPVASLATHIMGLGHKLAQFAAKEFYDDVENLAQELSGAGAKLKYLFRLS